MMWCFLCPLLLVPIHRADAEELGVRAYGYDYVDKCWSPQVGGNPWDTWYNPSKFMIQILLFYNPPFFWGGIIGISWGYIEYRMINTVEQWSRTPYVSRIFISSLRSRNSRPNSLGSSSRYSMPGASHGARAWRPRLRWGVFLWLVNACY